MTQSYTAILRTTDEAEITFCTYPNKEVLYTQFRQFKVMPRTIDLYADHGMSNNSPDKKSMYTVS